MARHTRSRTGTARTGRRTAGRPPVQYACAVIDSDGRRDFAATATLGVTAAVVLLDATRSLPAHPEIAWYRHLLDGVRRLVAAGAVTPTVTSAGGASLVRWQPVATPVWRSWSAVMWGAAPEIVTMNNPDPVPPWTIWSPNSPTICAALAWPVSAPTHTGSASSGTCSPDRPATPCRRVGRGRVGGVADLAGERRRRRDDRRVPAARTR